ncbi:hypothetical protein [Rubrivivax sp. JA1026]|uniref:hypothetical protein n=1 Tax=Rubrivivax sp. JA1026 TaxID=2710888 RepID=UPI0013E94338|nr:hypothetical protein [Rubrivivax sp. JA1026]
MNAPRAQIVLDGDVGPLRQKLREATAHITNFGRDSSSALGDTLAPAAAFQTKIAGLVAALSSGAFAAFLKSSIDMQDSMSKAAQRAGVTTEQFSSMAYAAKLADVDVTDLGKAYAKLGVLLTEAQRGQKEAVATLSRLKIDPKGIADADELLLQLADRFASMDDGARKTALAVDVFGEKAGPKLLPLLNAGRAGIEELREEAARLGVVISTEAGRQAEEFNDQMTKVQTAVQGAGLRIATSLVPYLESASSYFVQATKDAGLLEGTLISIGALMAKALGIDEVGRAESRYKGLQAEVERLQNIIVGVENTLRMDPDNAMALRRLHTLQAKLVDVQRQAAEAGAELDRITSNGSKAGDGTRGKPGRGIPDRDPPLPVTEKSQMAALEGRLAEERRVAAILDQGREYSKERELAFWRDILATVKLSSADRVAVMRKTATLEVDIAQKVANDQKALTEEQLAGSERLALAKVDAEQAAAKQLEDLGQISTLQLLQLEQQYETQRYEIQRAALAQRLQLLADDPTTTPAAKERLNMQLLLLEQQHQQRMAELQGKQAAKGAGSTIFGGDAANIFGSFQNSLDQNMNAMLTRTQSWGQAVQGIYRQTGAVFLAEMVTKPMAQYLAAMARQFAAKMGFLSAETTAQTTASTAITGAKGVETEAVTMMNATQAGTGAAAAVAPTPFVGPMMALAAMAAIFAAVSAMGRKSAARGYDIPSGVNPMTQLHEEEMVLPAHIANPLRAALAGGGFGGGDQAAGGAEPMVIKARSMNDLITVHDLVKTMRKAKRDFVITRGDLR